MSKLRPRAIAAALAIVAGLPAIAYWIERGSLMSQRNRVATHPAGPDGEKTWIPYRAAAIERPAVATAEWAGLGDDEVVLGIEVGGRARAYRLDAMRERTRHVINDMVGGVPVSVTYCDITDCVRSYAGAPGSGPPGMRLAGLLDGEMVVELGGVEYLQRSGEPRHAGASPLPLDLLSHVRTTWKRWKAGHPDTEVYTGEPPVPAAGRPSPAGARPD
ncbi:MAG TPA: DUF3179 domain-containing (seleno)protein [Isosphaeraceae bacterium]